MERLKSITIIFLLAVGLLASAASAKPASVLLQEGLYAEEIEGDLDAAIKIYEQVIAEAKETQRAAAHATYRIGMCYLKKGEKAKAAEQFRNLVSKFPEKKSLVTKARRQLAKLEPIGGLGSAEPVPVEQLIKSGKVPAFKTQIYDNTGLDLETGVVAPLKDDWPALFDVAWDNDGGGALMINPKSSVRFLALGAAEKWGDAISMARNTLAVLRTSTARGMFASQSKFVAILTSEGNLAVVRIGDYDTEKAMLYWWLEKLPAHGFGPVIERVVYHGGTVHECLIDFESGKLFKVPEGLKDSRGKESEVLEWVKETGVDAAGDTEGPITSQGLQGFVNDLVAQPAADGWNTTPRELVATMGSLLPEPHGKARMFAKGALPTTYFFKTRDGGLGVLQILGFTVGDPRGVRVRYKMLQEPGTVRPTFDFGPEVELTVKDISADSDMLIDFESAKLFTIPEKLKIADDFDHLLGAEDRGKVRAFFNWVKENGVDALADLKASLPRLIGFDMAAIPRPRAWSRSPDDLIDKMGGRATEEIAFISAKLSPTTGWYFKTREGGMGVLQILGFTVGDPRGVRVRYKMLQEPAKIAPVEVFGPAKVVGLYDIDHPTTTEKECAIDFDTGKLSKIPPQARRMPGDDLMKWLSGRGIDAVAEIAGKDRGLIGVYVAVKTMPPYVWDKISPTELRALMVNNYSTRQETTPMLLEDEHQQVFAFITRDSGLGILQILDVDKSTQKVKFRYKMLEDVRRPGAKIEYELQQLAESASKLKQLGLAVAMFAADHDSKLPDTLQELEPYVGKKQDFQWILENVEYLGKGKTVVGSFNLVTAYDKTLLEEGNGTNVLFGDSHVKFKAPKKLKELGITPKTPGATFDSKHR